MMDVQGKRALVVGLARSGRAAARVLQKNGALVTVTDSRPPASFQAEIRELTSLKIGLELGLHREATFLNQDLIVVSPGVPWDLTHLVAARQRKIPVVSEIEVASWFLKGPLVGITGSNGKTTTTALLGKMLEASGLPAFVGGNIGLPLMTAVEQARGESLLVAELSSFQLEAIQSFRPHVAVLLNLSPNHLDRHHSFAAYVGAKSRIFHNQTAEDYAILNADDPNVMSLAPAIASRKIFFSRRQNLPDGVFASNGHILYRVGNLERVLLERSDVRLRGDFNVEDVLAASAAACVVGADFHAVRRSVCEFKGVEHRLEFVRAIHLVEFYNDSKATSVDATAKALTAFDHGVHLILGGKDKGAPYTPLRPLLKDRAREVLVIGAAAEKIASDLEGAAEIIRAGDLETAVRLAFKLARPGDVVLLAPACASYDQFQDFEHRGRTFKELVERLGAETAVADSVRQVEIVNPEPVTPAEAVAAPSEQSPKPATEETPPTAKDVTPVAPAPAEGQTSRPAREGIAAIDIGIPAASARVQPENAESAEKAVALRSESLEKPAPVREPAKTSLEEEMAQTAPSTTASGPRTGQTSREALAPPAAPPELEAKAAPAHSGASTVPAPPTTAPASEPKGRPLELVYVYEVAAAEVAPMLDEVPDLNRGEESLQTVSESFAAPEVVSDELLPFEVPARAEAGPAKSNARVQSTREAASPLAKKEQPSLFEDLEGSERKRGT